MKKLSVIIPVYNTEPEYFQKCLDSLMCRHGDLLQVIVVDDGSSDAARLKTEKVIQKSSQEILYLKKENGGQNSARAFGLKYAVGEYIFFIDSDDYLDTSSLDGLFDILEAHSPTILSFNYDVVSPDGRILEKKLRWPQGFHVLDIHNGLLVTASLWTQIYKREFLDSCGVSFVQDVRIGEDMSSACAFLAVAEDAYSVGLTVYHYVKRPGSTLSSPPPGSALDIMKAFDKMMEQLPVTIIQEYHNELEWLAILHVLYFGSIRIYQSFYGDKQLANRLSEWINMRYPTWRNNPYFKTESIARTRAFQLLIQGKLKRFSGLVSFWQVKYAIKVYIKQILHIAP